MTSSQFSCDLGAPSTRLEHVWEHTVGSGHAPLALRADYQRQLSRCRRELGFRHVRFHGLLSDDMDTLIAEGERLIPSFFNTDQIFDFLLSIDMRPFVELSFMPTALASGSEVVFHYAANVTPPKSYDAWEKLIHDLASHWAERYGVAELRRWFFEVWNEPNLPAFWSGSQQEYFTLYQHTARALKAVSPELQVGGPATANNAWVSEFLDFCQTNAVPADFVTTHHYPTDAMGKPGDDTVSQLAASHRSVLREQTLATQARARGKPLYYTEWCTSSNPFDDLHDWPYASAFIVKTVMEARALVQGYSYWTFSDIFAENYLSSVPFHGGFGLLNIYGVPKPAYRAFQLLHGLGDEALPVEGAMETVDAYVTRQGRTVKALLCNSALPRQPVKTEKVVLSLHGVKGVRSAFVERIDDTHANARRAWVEQGSPGSLDARQVEALEAASALVSEPVDVRVGGGEAWVELVLPEQGTACVTLELE